MRTVRIGDLAFLAREACAKAFMRTRAEWAAAAVAEKEQDEEDARADMSGVRPCRWAGD